MQKLNDWTDWIKHVPDWVRNAIGLMTLIISFVLLFRSNLDLSILISTIIVLISLLLLSVYVIFKKSTVVGGGFDYRFPVARKWALVMIIPIITSSIFVVSNRTARDAIAAIFTSSNEAVDCGVILGLSEGSTGLDLDDDDDGDKDINMDDKSQILTLIETESTSVLYKETGQVMSIFTDASLIVDANGRGEWEGCGDIYRRYLDLAENVVFTALQHTPKELKISRNIATVETVSEVVYDSHYPYGESLRNQHKIGINRWTFIKYRGIWKVKTFVYGLPLR